VKSDKEEDALKTENTFVYEIDFSGEAIGEEGHDDHSHAETHTYVDLGFNLEGDDKTNWKTAAYTVNDTSKLFFINTDVVDCNYDTCEIMAEGCEHTYTQTDYLKMNAATPWTVTAQVDISEGYNTTFCFKCSSKWRSIVQDKIVVTQSP